MIDVIIPTILNTQYQIFEYTLNELNSSKVINKIIIIDNTKDQSFLSEYAKCITDKITIINGYDDELYVNGSWNMGVSLATAENYILLNDDILVNRIIYEIIDTHMADQNISLMTILTKNNVKLDDYIRLNSINMKDFTISTTNNIPNGRQGWFISGRTNEYVPIPSQLKIFYGDDWIYRKAQNKKVMIDNLNVSHFQSSSVNKNINKLKPMIDQDRVEWYKINKG